MSTPVSVVAGGPGDFMTVRQLRLSGSEHAIGAAMAREVVDRYGWRPLPIDPVVGKARRAWFERHWPQHLERLAGVAEVVGVEPGRDDLALDGLSSIPWTSGCSAVYCPPSATVDGHGRIGRNYDFFTMSVGQMSAAFGGGAASGGVPGEEPPLASRPYVVVSAPDDGYASAVVTMNELDAATEGVNAAGLSIALLMADVTTVQPPPENAAPLPGVSPVQLPKYVLDTCTTAEEARYALRDLEYYHHGAPCHYLVADAAGNSFVWELDGEGREHVIEKPGGPLCVTNHLLSRYPDAEALPEDDERTFHTYEHARTLAKRTGAGGVSAESLRETMDEVAIAPVPGYPWRTLWQTCVDVAAASLETRFYLGDGPDGAVRYSERLRFEAR